MLTLWGRLNSINVQKAVWALEELGLAYERIDAGRQFGVVDTPEYARLNPNRLVPTLRDGDFVLWESNSIVRYLAAKHGEGSLWPTDLQVRADADRWMDWQATIFSPAMHGAFWNLVRTAPEGRDEAAVASSLARCETLAAILDEHLKDKVFVAGDLFTAGDIAAGAITHRWLNLPARIEERPHLRAWYGRLMERPAAAKVLVTPIT